MGFAGCTVVSSVVVVLLVVRGSSEAQPESAPRKEASRQGSKSFFIILIYLTGHHALAHRSKRIQLAQVSCQSCCFIDCLKPIDANACRYGDSCLCYPWTSWLQLFLKWKNAFRHQRNRQERQAQTRQGRRGSDFLSYKFVKVDTAGTHG